MPLHHLQLFPSTPLPNNDQARITFEEVLERVRQRYQFYLFGYVIMPEQSIYFDFNVLTDKKRIEKLKYIRRNPVERVLSKIPRTGH